MRYLSTEKIPGRQRNRPLKDYAGQRFGRLVAVSLVERDAVWNGHKWLFACDCGNRCVASVKTVSSGNTRSCGCLQSELTAARNTTHGLSRKYGREYRSWKDMRGRCTNPSDTDYASYGGRGISICKQWDDFAGFVADMGKRPPGRTIERVDVNGNYEPSNCIWADAKTQANNKRTNRLLTHNGDTRTLQAWCNLFKIGHSKARYRLAHGWGFERTFGLL